MISEEEVEEDLELLEGEEEGEEDEDVEEKKPQNLRMN